MEKSSLSTEWLEGYIVELTTRSIQYQSRVFVAKIACIRVRSKLTFYLRKEVRIWKQ